MKIVVKELPLKVKIRISELEKTLFNIKALKVGDKVKAKVLSVKGEEYLLDMKGFRIKARMKFKVNVGEELTLRVAEKGEVIKFELVKEAELNSKMIKVMKELSKTVNITKELADNFEIFSKAVNSGESENLKGITKRIFVNLLSGNSSSDVSEKISAFLNSKSEKAIAKLIKFFLSELSSKDGTKLSETTVKETIENLIKENTDKIKSIFSERDDLEFFKNSFLEKIKSDNKIPKSLKESVENFIKSVEVIKNHNLSIKDAALQNPSINITSFIIPIFSSFNNKINFAKVDYKRDEKSKSFKLDKISLLLNMSNLGRVIVNLKKVGKVLRIDFLSENEKSKEFLKKEVDDLKKKLSPYFESIMTNFNISQREFEEFFEERIEASSSAIDIKV